MSTSYYVDLGFDINSAPKSNENGELVFSAGGQDLYTLQMALVNHSAGDVPAWFTHFLYDESTGVQDNLRFRIFDITDGINPASASASGWTPIGFSLFSTLPDPSVAGIPAQPAYPFSSENGGSWLGPDYPAGVQFGASLLDKQVSTIDSPVFGHQTCWFVNQTKDDREGAHFRFDQDGEFELSLSLTVQAPASDAQTQETRLFSCDPRMYVGPNSWP